MLPVRGGELRPLLCIVVPVSTEPHFPRRHLDRQPYHCCPFPPLHVSCFVKCSLTMTCHQFSRFKLLSVLPPACRSVDVQCQGTAMCSVAQVTRSLILCAVIVSSYSNVLSRTSDAFFDIMCCPACQDIVDYSVVHMMFCCCCFCCCCFCCC